MGWAVIWGDVIFLLFSADLDMLCSGSSSNNVKVICFMLGTGLPTGLFVGNWRRSLKGAPVANTSRMRIAISPGAAKFRPGIAFCLGLKLASKMALKKGNTNFRLEYSARIKKTGTPFQMFK